MKTLRKALSMTLMLAIVLTCVSAPSVFAAATFTDVNESTQFGKAIYELVDDGVLNGYEDGTFKPEGTITRAEFAKVIGVATSSSQTIWDAKETRFSDMAGHWAVPYVAYASNAGIINGYEDGTFRPDRTVTYAEAVKMIVCSLGYGPVVDTTLTPWYQGYINIANQIQLTKGAVTVADNGASRGLVAQLISNMKQCDRLVQTGTNADGTPTYGKIEGGKDFTDEDEFEDEGVVIGIYDNTLRGSEIDLTKSQICIDGEKYTLSADLKERDLSGYLGKKVEFVYTGSGKYTVNSIRVAEENEIEEISLDQFERFDGDKIYYYKDPERDTKTASVTFDDDIYIVYNGNGVPSKEITEEFLEKAFDIETGSITLYNNDSDKAVDVVFIEKYTTYFIGTRPAKNNGIYKINDKNNFESPAEIDEDDVAVYLVTKPGGEPASAKMSNITSNAVVSIATPNNSTSGSTIMVSAATVSGSVSSMDDDYDEIEISNKTYKVAPYFRRLLEKNASEYGFDVGKSVTLYLDYLGRIVSSKIEDSSAPYGYLVDYAESGNSINKEVQIMIFSSDNKWLELPLRDTVRINGKPYNKEGVITELKKSAAVINEAKPGDSYKNARVAQLIKYKTATEDDRTVISEISTIGNNDGDLNLSLISKGDGLKFTKSGSSFKDASGKIKFTINTSTLIFAVPADRAAAEKEYSKLKNTWFSDGASYNVEAYDISQGGTTAKAVIYYLGKNSTSNFVSITASTPSYIITEKKNATSDVDCHKIKVVKVGEFDTTKTIELYTQNRTVLADCAVGDVIKYVSSTKEIEENGNEVTINVIDDVQKIYVDGELIGGEDNYLSKDYDGEKEYYQVMLGTVYSRDIENDIGSIGISSNFAQKGEDGEYTFNEGNWKSFSVNSSTAYYEMQAGRNSKELQIRTSGDLIPAIGSNAPEEATQVLVVSYDKVVKGVYILGCAADME